MNNNRGFTLIELLVVIAIIGVLSSIVLASVTTARDRAQVAAGQQFSTSMYRSIGDDIVGMWEFNEGSGNIARDEVNNNNGTITNGAWTTDTPITGGRSLFFSNGEVSIPNIADYRFGTGNFTFSFWVKFNSAPSNSSYFEHGLYHTGILFRQANASALQLYTNGTLNTYTFTPSLNRWYHLAVARDNGILKVYVNGVQIGADAANAVNLQPTGVTKIASSAHTSGQVVNGHMDSFRIYRRAIGSAAIQKLYAEGIIRHILAQK